MLAHKEAYKIFLGQTEMLRPARPIRGYIIKRLKIDAVFNHVIGALVAILAERLCHRFLGDPDMIDVIIEFHNSLDLIVYNSFYRNCTGKIIPYFE
jgi:hypothetical protein